MTVNPPEHPEEIEAFTLAVSLFEQRLEEPGIRRLEQLVCDSAAARRVYVRVAHQYCAIVPLIAALQPETLDEPAAETASTDPVEPPVVIRPRRPWVWAAVAAAAAVVVCVLGVVWTVTKSSSYATLSAETGAAWDVPLTAGQSLPDRPIRLTAGLAKIKTTGGAEVIVEAPAAFRISTPDEFELISGSVTATVPPAAHGFAVRTASARVVDLGTEFGVEVGADRSTYVAVFRGSVQTAGVGTRLPPAGLSAGQAVLVDPKGITAPAAASTARRFTRSDEFDARVVEAGLSVNRRWRTFSYQLRRDSGLVAYYLFDPPPGAADKLVNDASTGPALDGVLGGGDGVGPTRSVGRWSGKTALSFKADGLQSMTIPPTAELEFATDGPVARPFSVLLWVNADETQPVDASIFTHGKGRAEQYSVGVQGGKFRGWVRAFKALPNSADGKTAVGPAVTSGWHQLVFTVDPSLAEMFLYVDGEPGPKVIPPRTLVPAAAEPAMLGARVSHEDKLLPSFNGAVDELAVFSRALSRDEVQRLYAAEKP